MIKIVLTAFIFLNVANVNYGFALQNKIIATHKIQNLSGIFSKITKEALVLWDVDYVIITPKDLCNRPNARSVRRSLFKEYEQKGGIEKVKYLHSLIMLKAPGELVESEVGNLIHDLQQKKIKTMALTSMETGEFGVIKSPVDFRINSLKELGIDFSMSTLFHDIFTDSWVLKGGILFTNRVPKGEVLLSFLKLLPHQPSEIIFIDDSLENIKNVADACKNLKIPFLGVHYEAEVLKNDPESDPRIARIQFNHLYKTGVWLSDKDAIFVVNKESLKIKKAQ